MGRLFTKTWTLAVMTMTAVEPLFIRGRNPFVRVTGATRLVMVMSGASS